MDLKKEETKERFSEISFDENEENNQRGELFIEREESEDFFAEDVEEEVPNWGVYLQGKEKTLLGLFWDLELATIFLNAVKNTTALERVKEIA